MAESLEHVKLLAQKLLSTNMLASYLGRDEPVEFETAYVLSEVRSCAQSLIALIDSIYTLSSPDDIVDVVAEIREEVRAMYYQVKQSEYLSLGLEALS